MTSIRKNLAGIPAVRSVMLRVLRAIGDRDIAMRHPTSKTRFTMHLFRHRGYWYHRQHREANENAIVAAVLSDSTGAIVDVGANIGFLTAFYQHIAPAAKLIAVEPSPTNLRYLRQNVTGAQVRVETVAVGREPGSATLFEDDLTGQNSSLVEDFQVLAKNAAAAGVRATVEEVRVPVETLDRILRDDCPVDFIKIDVEGYELDVLLGATGILEREHPLLQIEVQKSIAEALRLLNEHGYKLFTSGSLQSVLVEDSPHVIFGAHSEDPRLDQLKTVAGQYGYFLIDISSV